MVVTRQLSTLGIDETSQALTLQYIGQEFFFDDHIVKKFK